MYLWTICEAFTNIEILNQAKFYDLDFEKELPISPQ